jgi:hypothetical protein
MYTAHARNRAGKRAAQRNWILHLILIEASSYAGSVTPHKMAVFFNLALGK